MGWKVVKDSPSKWSVVKPEVDAVDEPAEESSFLSDVGDTALEAVGAIGQAIDPYTGVPARAYLGARQKNEPGFAGFGEAVKAGVGAFGADPSTVPTEKELAQAEGYSEETMSEKFPDAYVEPEGGKPSFMRQMISGRPEKGGFFDPTESGLAGGVIGAGADITNFIPGKMLATGVSKAARGAGKVLSKGASTFSGVPQQVIEKYAKHMPEINQRIGKYGEDVSTAADDVRTGYESSIKSTRRSMGHKIKESLNVSGNNSLNIDDVSKSLLESRTRLNPTLHAGDIAEIDDLIKMVDDVKGVDGQSTVRDIFDLKEILQERAKGSYQKAGQIFIPGSRVQRAAKQAAYKARKTMNASAPSIAEANNKLSLLHDLEDKLNKNLIGPGRSEAALSTAGAGTNTRGAKQLKRLGELTESDMLGEAQKFSAQRSFTKPDLLPVDTTGKSAARIMMSSAAGFMSGIPGGQYMLPVATSPAALKTGMRLGAPVVKGINKAGRPGYLGAANLGRQQEARDRTTSYTPESIISRLQRSGSGGRFTQAIQEAAKRGGSSVNTTYFLLMHNEPEFRKAMEESN